jgi:hypothetical protein
MNGATVLSAGVLGNIPTPWSMVGDYDGDGAIICGATRAAIRRYGS